MSHKHYTGQAIGRDNWQDNTSHFQMILGVFQSFSFASFAWLLVRYSILQTKNSFQFFVILKENPYIFLKIN